MFGEAGHKAVMQEVPPCQSPRFHLCVARRRAGPTERHDPAIGDRVLECIAESSLQQVLAAEGKKLVLSPLIEQMVINGFGPELGARTIVDVRETLTNPPEMEDEWMLEGLMAHVHPLDDDNQHMRAHFKSMQSTGDPTGLIRPHMMAHQQQAAQKLQAQAMQQMQMQQQGAGQPSAGGPPAGGPGRPPGAAAPQPGASPAGPRLVAKGPPGMIHPDQLPKAGGIPMNRNM